MALLSWKEFMAARESSPATRSKTASALGLGPDVADVFGHATPPPWQTERLLKKLHKGKPKKDDEDDEPIEEKREMRPDYSFDRLVRKAAAASDEIDREIGKAEKEVDRLDKEKEKKDKREKQNLPKIGPRPQKPEDDDTEDESPHDVDHKPTSDIKKMPDPNKEKAKVQQRGEADELTEEEAWLRLLGDTSFDPH